MASERKKTVLIVEDSSLTREKLRGGLSSDYNILLAENGQLGLDTLLRESRRISCVLLDIQMPVMDGFEFLRRIRETDALKWIPIIVISGSLDDETESRALRSGAWGYVGKTQSLEVIKSYIENAIFHRSNYLALEEHRLADIDAKTGIWNKEQFYRAISHTLEANPDEKFCLIRFDIDRFKVFNDIFGVDAGDRLLRYVGDLLKREHPKDSLYAHIEADHFALFFKKRSIDAQQHFNLLSDMLSGFPVDFDFSIKAGIYEIDDPSIEPGNMCDRALLALRTTKSSATKIIGYYDSELRDQMLLEQTLVTEIKSAFDRQEFEVYYQPQFNYSTGEMIGAEALVRWNHPERGLVLPGVFIPVMEKNGLISKLDEYVWEQCCRQLRRWQDSGSDFEQLSLSISTNVSRIDIYRKDLCEFISTLADKYGVPHHILKLEITESAYMESPEQLLSTVSALREAGFVVEMDDFGSGYSSLNTLKDVPVDILKLDMMFLSASKSSPRGGSILSSVVRMARWLKLPVIAEGVETKEQADYLKSIGCLYMQGYYFARPMTAAAFEELVSLSKLGATDKYSSVDTRKADQFWDASAQSALIFNSFVGGACILELSGDEAEVVRVNDRYLEIVNSTREEYLPLMKNVQDHFIGKYRNAFLDILRKAAETGEETSGELCSKPLSEGRSLWTMCRVRLLARNVGSDMFYISVEDITEQRRMREELLKQTSFLQAIYECAPSGVLLYDVVNDVPALRNCNEQTWSILGFDSMEAFLADAAVSFLPKTVFENDRGMLLEYDRQLLSGEAKRIIADFRVALPDGDCRWLRSFSEREHFRDGTDVIKRVLSDVTEQKLAEHSNYGSAVLSVYDEASLVDYASNTCTLLHSKYSKKAPGIVTDDFSGTISSWIDKVVYPDDRAVVRAQYEPVRLRELCSCGEIPAFEYRSNVIGGNLRWFRCFLVPLGSDRYLTCNMDITASRHAAELATESALFRLQQELLNIRNEQGEMLLRHFGMTSGTYAPAQDIMEYAFLDDAGEFRFCRMEGYLRNALHRYVSQQDQERFRAAIAKASEQPSKGTLDFLADFSGSGEQLHQLRYVSIAGEDGSVSLVVFVIANIQDRYEFEEFSLDLSDQFDICGSSQKPSSLVAQMLDILNNSDEPNATIDTLLKIIGENMDASRVYVLSRMDRSGQLAMTNAWYAPDAPLHNMELMDAISSEQFAECLLPAIGLDGQMRCSDTTTLPPFARDVYEKNKVKAVMLCAITRNGWQRGYLCIDECRAPRDWQNMRRQLLSLISRLIGALQQKTVPASATSVFPTGRMRQSLTLTDGETIESSAFQKLLNAASVTVVEWSKETSALSYTAGYLSYELSRHNFRKLYCKNGDELAHPDDYPKLASLYSATTGNAPEHFDVRLRMIDGSLRMTRIASHFEYSEGGELRRALIHFTDVQQEYEQIEQLAEHDRKALDIIQNVPIGLAVYDADKNNLPVFYSDNALELFGFTRNDFEALDSASKVAMLDSVSNAEKLVTHVVDGVTLSTLKAFRRDGSWFWLSVCSSRVMKNGRTLIFSALSDITEHVNKERDIQWQLERYRVISGAVNTMTYDYDPETDVMTYTIPSPEGGLDRFEARDYIKNFENGNRVHPSSREVYLNTLKTASVTPGPGVLEYVIDYVGDGSYKWYRTTYVSVSGDDGKVFRVVGKAENIDDEKRERNELLQRAQLDGTTGLINKDTARMEIEKLLLKKPQDRFDALMMIDLDDFKQVNDSYGHAAGDALLHSFASRLRALIPAGNITSRFGGDEFLVYFPSAGSEEAVVSIAQAILAASRSLSSEYPSTSGCSIGITFIQRRRLNIDSALSRADYALYVSKKQGKHCYTVFDPTTMDESAGLLDGSGRLMR